MYIAAVKAKSVPTLELPTTDYEQMQSMSNHRLVCLLRSAVLAPERVGRFSPRPPMEHDAYRVQHGSGNIAVHLYAEGAEVFCCRFVPAE